MNEPLDRGAGAGTGTGAGTGAGPRPDREPISRAARSTGSARHRGMTLVEVLAVVVILGLIAGTLLVGFSGTFGRAKHELARSGIGVIVGKLEAYRVEHGTWPGSDVGLRALAEGSATGSSYHLGADHLNDPWNRPYLYVVPGPAGLPYEVITYGADGVPGGEGENRDISSATLRKRD
ncbi:MAG TPA: type II secretion system protein GspG [Phycisphaerales bacterium]|nr:type II secretion system protein GspG [Phycisphaerales bacterium]HMP37808.1 type II secretion system protein GspG [Phycisphaerales bacterium]